MPREPFQKPRILSDSEANAIRGKCLVAKATPQELMQLLGHFDMLISRYHHALETLAGCLPDPIYVYGAYGDRWSEGEPDVDEYETVSFKELLGDENA
jgi:hypothetical protein